MVKESIALCDELATVLICSAMAVQSVPSEEPEYQGRSAALRSLDTCSSDGWKNAPIAFSKKTVCCFFAHEECASNGKITAIQQMVSLLWSSLLSLVLLPCDPSCGRTSH